MITKPIQVEILEESKDGLKVKLPFFEVPVEMNWAFFNKRLDAGYFKLLRSKNRATVDINFLPLTGKKMK